MRKITLTALSLTLATVVFITNTEAMPNFARKYNLPCSGCHTVIPRLNETGFNFRAAGYRMPEEIGKPVPTFNLGDYVTGRVQANYAISSSTPAGATSPTATTNQMQFTEFTLYPITGALTKNLSSMAELTLLPEDFMEVENAYVRYNTGDEKNFFSARAGIFHPFEGYGASDRPMALTRPMIQTTAANQTGSTYFTPWNFDMVGAELGYNMNRTSIRAAIFNGIYYNPSEAKAFPATGGNLIKPAGAPSNGSLDFQLFLTQLLTEDGGGVSGYLYAGNIDLPTGLTSSNIDSAYFQDKYLRYAIYASYPIQRALVLAGYQQGTDNTWNKTTWAKGDNFGSKGWFAEANYTPVDLFGFGLRYDAFDPSDKKDNNELSAISIFANYAFGDGLQFIGEFKNKTTKKGLATDGSVLEQKDNSFNLRLIWIQ